MPPKIAPPLPLTAEEIKNMGTAFKVISDKHMKLYIALTQLAPIQTIINNTPNCIKDECKAKAKLLETDATLYAKEYGGPNKRF